MDTPMYDVHVIIDFFLSKSPMSNKKLQKILYYAYSWTIALVNEDRNHIEYRLFKERPQAWVHGPAFYDVYREYKQYGWDDIPMTTKVPEGISKDMEHILDDIWNEYSKYSANELESMTHQEEPWIRARGDLAPFESSSTELNDQDIFDFYNYLYQKDDFEQKSKKQKVDFNVPKFPS